MAVVLNYLWFALAAFCEIGGCYAFWMWLRLGKSPLWLIPGAIALFFFALALTRVDADAAGRAFAAYGGIYIVASFAWLVLVEHARPLASDGLGIGLCVLGAAVILFGPRFSAI